MPPYNPPKYLNLPPEVLEKLKREEIPDNLRKLQLRDAINEGWAPIVATIAAEGHGGPTDISRIIEQDYGVYMSAVTIGHILNKKEHRELVERTRARISAELQRDAIQKKSAFDKHLTRLLEQDHPNTRDLQAFAAEYRAWWDRLGKLHFPDTSNGGTTVNVQQNSITVNNPVQVLLESLDDPAVANDPKMVTVIDAMISKLQGQKNVGN